MPRTQRCWSLVLLLGGCQPDDTLTFAVPDGFPELVVPEDNPLTDAKIALGRHLFYDTRLSGNQEQACASCHVQEQAFTDGLARSIGSTGMIHPRNSSSLTNAAFNSTLTWANPLLTDLEQQFLTPIFSDAPVELGADDAVLDRLETDPNYTDLFAAAYGRRADLSWDLVIDGLASFVRTMVSGTSRFDRFTYGGDNDALSLEEKRGLALFFSERLECQHCHGGFNFSESTTHAGTTFEAEAFHNNGLYNLDGEGAYPTDNVGLLEFTGNPDDMGRFRPPTLRNIAVTAPYMHDGSLQTLEEVIDHYARGGRLLEDGPYAGDGALSPLKSGFVAGFELTQAEKADLIAFLEALTDDDFLSREALSNPFD